jgi:rhamnogalacturonyl hydrolase YesR
MKDRAFQETVENSIAKVTRWIEEHDYKAYDPGDGNSSFLHCLTFDNLLLERLLQQAVYRCPFNLRPWIGIHPHTSTKGMGYIAWGYAKMFKLKQDSRYRDGALHCLQWLIDHPSPGNADYCWGNHFPFSTRGGKIPAMEPTIVWSSLIGQAFLENYEVFGETRYLTIASSICDWILKLPREKTESGSCLSYVAHKQSSIHNANMLGAALLASVGKYTSDSAKLEVARDAMMYSCSRQNPDGAWFYGAAPQYHWIDNFHTGYNLDSLKRYIQASGDESFSKHQRDGFVYFKRTFFEPDGRPKYYHNRALPTDIQCAAQAIDTLSFFSDDDPEALPLAQKVAAWTINNMQGDDGHFYYRDLGWVKAKTPMLHWGQGTMFKALAHCLTRLAN